MDPNNTRINRVPYSWTSCAHFFQGLPYKGMKAVTFKETREVKLVYDADQAGRPIGITAGAYKVENVSFTILRDSAAGLLQDLTALGLGSYGDAEFTYMLQTFEPVVPPTPPQTTLISGCRITGIEDGQEQGTDELVTKIDVQAMFIVRNVLGLPMTLWSQVRALL